MVGAEEYWAENAKQLNDSKVPREEGRLRIWQVKKKKKKRIWQVLGAAPTQMWEGKEAGRMPEAW